MRTRLPLSLFGKVGEMLIGLALGLAVSRTEVSSMGSTDLKLELESVRQEYKLPAMAAAMVKDGKLVASDAVGVRKLGSNIPVTVNDEFHIGSCTKSMTATLAAMLVDEGKLKWDTTISEVFPTVPVNSSLQKVTLEQLLSHRSGIRADLSDEEMDHFMHSRYKPVDQRSEVMAKLLPEAPEHRPGEEYSYSNLGVTVAGTMIERKAGKPWERLVQDRIFRPLGMKTAGFGAPEQSLKIDQPWGHTATSQGGYEPFSHKVEDDNPPAIAPAAAVHCSVTDLAKYAIMYLQASRGESPLLSKSAFEKLASDPYRQEYGLGWIVVGRSWAKGRALTHAGSNTMFYTVIWIAPNQNFALVVSTNAGGEKAMEALNKVVHDTVLTL